MPVLLADGSLGIVLFWVAFVIIANVLKKKPAQSAQPRQPGDTAPPAQAGLLGELKRAMEELKRAELQQRSRETGQTLPPTPPAPRVSVTGPGQQRSTGVQQRSVEQERKARAYLEEQKRRAAARRSTVKRPPVTVVPDEEDASSEVVSADEGRDYDDQAETIALARRAAAERVERVDDSSEGLSTLQQARRSARPDVTIGGAAEHSAWHDEIGRAPAAGQAKKEGALKRFGDGSAKGAVVLSEIFGRPASQR